MVLDIDSLKGDEARQPTYLERIQEFFAANDMHT